MVRTLVERGGHRSLLRTVPAHIHEQPAGPPATCPARAALEVLRAQGDAEQVTLVECWVSGGLAPQTGLCAKRAATSADCQWCGAGLGSHHRGLFACDGAAL
eukprot:4650095-Pyramimonas_sp.AAC.1